MKNPLPLLLLLALAALLAYGLLSGGSPAAIGPSSPGAPSAQAPCIDGQTQYCRLGNCSGISACIGGAWTGCRWERVCEPGSRVPCLKNNCPYALKECDECGTGYGPCMAAAPP